MSVAFAGFSGVVAAFGRRDPETWSFADRARFYVLVRTSLAALFFCIVPFCLSSLYLPEAYVWRIASALMVAYFVISRVQTRRQLRAASAADIASISHTASRLIRVVDMTAAAVSFFNVVIVGAVGPFLLALVLLLVQAGFFFARMLFLSLGDGARPDDAP